MHGWEYESTPETFTMLATAWHNSTNPFDVDNDGNATPLDVLIVINFINSLAGGEGPEGEGMETHSNNTQNITDLALRELIWSDTQEIHSCLDSDLNPNRRRIRSSTIQNR